MNILFDRETLQVTGMGRKAHLNEVELSNVEIDNSLNKEILVDEEIDKIDENGFKLYFLPQEDKVEEQFIDKVIETVEETEEPVMTVQYNKVPLLDEEGKQVEYEVTQQVIIPAEFDEEGNIITEEKVEIVGTGNIIKCFITEETQVQKTDNEGNKLYYKQIQEPIEVLVPQEPLIINEENELFVEGLETVKEIVQVTKTIVFYEDPYKFTYDEVLPYYVPTEIDLLKQDSEDLKKRVDETENAVIALMDMSLMM